jgi:hypothetical protein
MVREVGAVEEGQRRNDPRGFLAGDGSMDGKAKPAAKQVRQGQASRKASTAARAWPGWAWTAARTVSCGPRPKKELVLEARDTLCPIPKMSSSSDLATKDKQLLILSQIPSAVLGLGRALPPSHSTPRGRGGAARGILRIDLLAGS